jgi:sugar/nucleoside kinase (ribokinase family)
MKTNPEVLCAGIIVADHVCHPVSHVPAAGELVMTDKMLLTIGGCAANAAVDLTRMEVSAAVVGRVGDDAFGRIVGEMLREQGVDTTAIQTSPGADTSQTLIVNVAGQDRRFIHTFGANAIFRAADIPLEFVKRCRVLYLGGFLAMPFLGVDELVPVFAAARQAGVKTVLDVVVPHPGEYMPILDELLPFVDVFLPNNHEGEMMTGESDPVKQAETYHWLGAKTAVVTMGAEGAILVSEQARLRADVFPVPYVDGSGGGDAFDAGFIYGLLKNMTAEDCLRIASALGASCVRAIGTTPGVFTRAECEEFLRKNTLRIDSI